MLEIVSLSKVLDRMVRGMIKHSYINIYIKSMSFD